MSKICFYSVPHPSISSYFDLIDYSVSHGLTHLEGFCRFELTLPDKQAAKKIKAYADAKGISFSCFSVFVNLISDDAPEMIERLKGFAEVCAILECPYLHHTIASNFSNPEEVLCKGEENFQKGIKAVGKIYDYAEGLGVKTIYEEQGYIFNGVNGFGRFLKEVDRNVGVVVDFGNIYQAGNTPEEFINAFGHLVKHVHIKDVLIKDNNATGQGFKTLDNKYMFEVPAFKGCVDIRGLIARLESKGYKGFYGLEFAADKENIEKIDLLLKG